MIVVDASVAMKWLVQEQDSSRAVALFRDQRSQICGPDLLAVEVSRALVAAGNSRRMAMDVVRRSLALWFGTVDRIILHRCDALLIERAASLALALGHPLADCVYLVLAIDLGAHLVTSDIKFHARAAAQFSTVKLLAEFV